MLKSTLGFVAAAAFGLGLVQSASAADLPVKAAPMVTPAPFTWTGWYIGAHVGSGWGTVESTVNSISAGGLVTAGTLPFSSHNINGYLGGAQAGYNWQVSPIWVVGVEGDFSWSDIDGTAPCLVVLGCKTKVKWMADITGRIGFTVDHALIYLKGGAAWADTDYSVTTGTLLGAGGGIGLNASTSKTRFGGLLGVGVEYAITRNLSAKVEYNYIDFGSNDVTVATVTDGMPFTATSSVEQQIHLIKAGANFRF